MKRKFFLHLFLFFIVLFGLWYLISQIDFRKIINAEEKIENIEEKLGRWTFRYFQTEYEQIENKIIDSLITNTTQDLFLRNDFKNNRIQIFLFKSDDINAFAIPGNKIIVFTGLIEFTQTEEEFLGIIAHEIAHIEENHITRKISKEIGLSTLFALLFASHNMEIIKDVAQILTSTAYDRNLEKEADLLAVNYLIEARIDPLGYINLLMRFDEELETMPKELQLLSTHPDALERSETLREILEKKTQINFAKRETKSWIELKSMMGHKEK